MYGKTALQSQAVEVKSQLWLRRSKSLWQRRNSLSPHWPFQGMSLPVLNLYRIRPASPQEQKISPGPLSQSPMQATRLPTNTWGRQALVHKLVHDCNLRRSALLSKCMAKCHELSTFSMGKATCYLRHCIFSPRLPFRLSGDPLSDAHRAIIPPNQYLRPLHQTRQSVHKCQYQQKTWTSSGTTWNFRPRILMSCYHSLCIIEHCMISRHIPTHLLSKYFQHSSR